MQANLDRLSKDQEEHRKSLAEEKSKAEQLTIEKEEAQAKWKEEKVSRQSRRVVLSDLARYIKKMNTITVAMVKLAYSLMYLLNSSLDLNSFSIQDKSASVMSDLRMKIDSLTTTIASQKEDAKAMELELTKARFDRDAFEEDAETRMVRIRILDAFISNGNSHILALS